jgi:K(+)-stimulated pyrophosphate-energized sodium pump
MALIGYLIPVAALVALVWALVRVLLLRRLGAGGDKLREATGLADKGAKAFLGRDHVFFDLLILVVAVGIGLANRYSSSARGLMAVAIVAGAGFAGIAAWAIMRSSLLAGGRAAQAAEKGFGPAHRAVFGGGMVAAMCAVGFALLGVAALYLVGLKWFGPGFEKLQLGLPAVVTAASGFAAGAALVALFGRGVGAVYGHAAQHGVERAAKAEEQAPADDVRNPASLARLSSGMLSGVGVGLLAAFSAAIVSAMVVGSRWILPIHHTNPDYESNLVVLPLILGAVGIVCALLGVFLARAKEEQQATGAAYLGVLLAEVLFLAAAWFVTSKMLLTPIASAWGLLDGGRLFLAVGLGVAVGHVSSVAAGMAPKGKAGWGASLLVAAVVFAAAWVTYANAGLYGVALSAVGLVATAGIQAASAA